MPRPLTRRDRANAMTAYAFRNGHLENLHAGRRSELWTDAALARFTRHDLQMILRESSRRMGELLRMRSEGPQDFTKLLAYHRDNFTRDWIRSPRGKTPVPMDRSIEEESPTVPSIEQEARALACYSFIDGFLARWHRGRYSALLEDAENSRIDNDRMASLMIDSSERLAGCLALQWQNAKAYNAWIHNYQSRVDDWLAEGPAVADPDALSASTG